MKSKITLMALAVVFIASCKAKKEVITEQKIAVVAVVENKPAVLSPVVENPETIKLAATYDGKTLYQNDCANCHKLYSPEDYSKEEWVPVLKAMQKKARITDAETLAIYNYLSTQTK